MKATHNSLLRPLKHQKKQLTFLKAISLFISILHTQDKNHNNLQELIFMHFVLAYKDFVIWGVKFQFSNNWPVGTVAAIGSPSLMIRGHPCRNLWWSAYTKHNFCSGPLVPDLHNSGCAVQYCRIRSQRLVNI